MYKNGLFCLLCFIVLLKIIHIKWSALTLRRYHDAVTLILKALNTYITFSFSHRNEQNKYATCINLASMACHENDFVRAITGIGQ